MNAVELDVGNLNQWVLGNIGAEDPWSITPARTATCSSSRIAGVCCLIRIDGNITTGEYGFEDVINSGSATGTPDGNLEPLGPTGFSPEDVDENTVLDAWGAAMLEMVRRVAQPTAILTRLSIA